MENDGQHAARKTILPHVTHLGWRTNTEISREYVPAATSRYCANPATTKLSVRLQRTQTRACGHSRCHSKC